jgi:hypothetical protein
MAGPLHLDVFVVPYKPIVGLTPPMGEGEATWPATSVSLISGEHDAVLIDDLLTPEDAGRLVEWIRATGKKLTTISARISCRSQRDRVLLEPCARRSTPVGPDFERGDRR